ncbi:MAG: Gfo/Idh/MocA family oxidoreductase, partial [Prosthecobacter sp.]|nr:Gfo/Idh/MocA family oxidoreductase [Prosthecobacter sp.]
MSPTSRRTFLTSASLSLAALPLVAAEGKKYRTALIGSGWWGMNILREAIAHGRCEVVALCDVDATVLENGIADIEAETGTAPKGYKDYRDLLAEARPEIVIIGTPDHWHALQSIAACQAGAHVYVEKPTGHTIAESRAMVEAAKKAGVTVQVGLHRRIGPHH